MIQDRSTVGGARCVADSTAAAEVAAVGVWWDRGSRDEAPAERGATHFIEHMLFKGAAGRSSYDLARAVDRLGGSINAFTERECMCVHVTIPTEGLDEATSILADMAGAADFPEAEFERERNVIDSELEAVEDDPEETAFDLFHETLWPSHPLGRPIGGKRQELAALTRDGIAGLYQNFFRSKPSLVSAAGAVDSESLLSLFKQDSDHAVLRPQRTIPIWPTGGDTVYKSLPFQQVTAILAFPVPHRPSLEDFYAFQLANCAFGDSMSSRLFQSVRETKGLCYSIYSTPAFYADTAMWVIHASAKPSDAPALLDAISGELAKLKADGLEAQELADARSQILGGLKIEATDFEFRMRRIARQALYGFDPHDIGVARSLIQNLDSRRAAALFLGGLDFSQPFIFGSGPAGAKKAFLAAADRMRRNNA